MADQDIRGTVLIVIGVMLLIVSLAADVIGIGGAAGFGYRQITGAVLGTTMAVIGFVLNLKK